MATFKLNVGHIRGCPPPAEIAAAMEEFGLPESEEFGVLEHSATAETAFATIIRRTDQTVQRLDPETQGVTTVAVEKVTLYPFAVRPAGEVLEVYAGAASSIEQVGEFFSGCLALPIVVDPIELDIASAVDKLAAATQRFQLRSIRISDYAHNSYMSGPYAPKFLDTEHGKDFLGEYADYVLAATVRFQTPGGRANVNLTPKACFSFSCGEEDQTAVLSILRKLI